jgi:hypothetical protein
MPFASQRFVTRSFRHLLDSPTDRQFDQRLLLLGCESLFAVALIHTPLLPEADSLISYAARVLPRSLEEGETLPIGSTEPRLCGPTGAALQRLELLAVPLRFARLQQCIASPISPWPNILHPVGLEALGALLELSPAFFSPEPRDILNETVLRAIETIAADSNKNKVHL